MAADFIKQGTKPLFADLLWSRPLNPKAAGKLVVIGGHKTQFSATHAAYAAAQATGVGSAKVLMPETARTFTGSFPDAVFLPATASGSLALAALEPAKEYIAASDGTLLSGEFSRNRETISLIERLLATSKRPLALGGETVHGWSYAPNSLLAQSNRLVIATAEKLAPLQAALGLSGHIQPDKGVLNRVLLVEKLAAAKPAAYVLLNGGLTVHAAGRTSVTEFALTPNRALVLGVLATFWLQNENKFEALTTAAFLLKQTMAKTEAGTLSNIRQFLKQNEQF